jgi:hypothetical protein
VLALGEALAGAGVTLFLDTLACLPVMDGNRVVGVEVENKSGRGFAGLFHFRLDVQRFHRAA